MGQSMADGCEETHIGSYEVVQMAQTVTLVPIANIKMKVLAESRPI